jgi:hypothetical protein
MPVKKKKVAAKVKKTAPKKAAAAKAKSAKPSPVGKAPLPLPVKKKHTVYIESAAFFPPNSADGYVDLFQDGRRTAVAGRSLSTAIVLPVGAVLKSISIHYFNSTPIPFFLSFYANMQTGIHHQGKLKCLLSTFLRAFYRQTII